MAQQIERRFFNMKKTYNTNKLDRLLQKGQIETIKELQLFYNFHDDERGSKEHGKRYYIIYFKEGYARILVSPDIFWEEDLDRPINIEFFDWFGFFHYTYFSVLTQPMREENAVLKFRLKNKSLTVEQLLSIDQTLGANPEAPEAILDNSSIYIREYDILGKKFYIQCIFDIDEPIDKMPDSIEEFFVTIKHVFIMEGDMIYEC